MTAEGETWSDAFLWTLNCMGLSRNLNCTNDVNSAEPRRRPGGSQGPEGGHTRTEDNHTLLTPGKADGEVVRENRAKVAGAGTWPPECIC